MQSCLPIYLQYMQALSVPLLACFGAYIAYRQYRTGLEKLRLDLFEKRLETFSLAEEFASNVLREGYPNSNDMVLSGKARGQARFLFGEDVGETLKDLHEHAIKLRHLQRKIDSKQNAAGDNDAELMRDLFISFNGKYELLPEVFKKYIHFPNSNRAILRRCISELMERKRQ